MRLDPTDIDGVMLVWCDRHEDERGSFDRSFCQAAFLEAGIRFNVTQANISRNPHRGTLRGLHYQSPPHSEAKIVSCAAGRVWDVAVDARPQSPTYRRWAAAELSPKEPKALYLAPGIAHGFLTLEPNSEVNYLMDGSYAAEAATGLRWDDPAFAISWPFAPLVISERDRAFALLGGPR